MTIRVLIVEDEALVAMLVEDAVARAGAEVWGTVANIGDAIETARTGDFDVALLDMNLGGQKAHAVPAILARRNKRFAFVTGYGEEGVLETYSEAPVVRKPFREEEIADVLAALTENRPDRQ